MGAATSKFYGNEHTNIDVFLPSLRNYDQIGDESWMEAALCKVVHEGRTWFSAGKNDIERAKEVCRECSVDWECLRWSIVTGQRDGIWGGLDETERRPLIKDFELHLEENQREECNH